MQNVVKFIGGVNNNSIPLVMGKGSGGTSGLAVLLAGAILALENHGSLAFSPSLPLAGDVCFSSSATAAASRVAVARAGRLSWLPLEQQRCRAAPPTICGLAGSSAIQTDVSSLDKALEECMKREADCGWKLLDRTAELGRNGGVSAREWSVIFGEIAKSEEFSQKLWAKQPFKLGANLDVAVGAFGMSDLKKHAHDYPYFYAGIGTLVDGGGWMMAKFDKTAQLQGRADCMQADEVEEQLEKGTVALNSAGFFIQPLAVICEALLEALQLPVWLNIYITAAGKAKSAPAHTDKQDVIAIQTEGSKRWRVFRPPPTADKVSADPFTRGKGMDQMTMEELGEPLVDTILKPGEMLYMPAGYPHMTDTVDASQTSVHLTLGVDTHVWDLNYACMRETALKREGLPTLIEGSFVTNKLGRDEWAALHEPLPLGFTAAKFVGKDKEEGTRSERAEAARRRIEAHMSEQLALKIIAAEPKRWEGEDAASLEAKLKLSEVASRYFEHYLDVMEIERRVYADASHQLRPIDSSFARAGPYLEELQGKMEALHAWAERREVAPSAPAAAAAPAKGAGGMGKGASKGMGKGMGMGGKKGKKK